MATESRLSSVASVLARIHADMPPPNARLEDDGDVGLDWQEAANCVLSIHVSEDGSGGWAGLVGEHKNHGRFHVPDDWPDELVKIQQLYVEMAGY